MNNFDDIPFEQKSYRKTITFFSSLKKNDIII